MKENLPLTINPYYRSMKSCSILLASCLLLLYSGQSFGQNSQGHVYEDSSILYPPEEIIQPIEEGKALEETTGETADEEDGIAQTDATDTSLVQNRNILSPDSIALLKNTPQFGYAKNLDSLLRDYKKKQELKPKETVSDTDSSWIISFFTSKITQFLFWTLAVFFIGFIVYKLFFSGGFFQRQTTRVKINPSEEDDDRQLKDHNYDALIAAAKKQLDYRLATRYLYLRLLQKLTASGAIEFAVDKTNTEYMRELTGKPYKQEVAALTLNYEYVWYGEFAIDATVFARLETRFKNINV